MLLPTQAERDVECAQEYRTLTGQPCVPALFVDIDCDDLSASGIYNVQIVDESDPYDLDRGGDGVGCETVPPRTATGVGDEIADIAPFAAPIAVLLVLAGTGALLWRAREAHEAISDPTERLTNRFTLYLSLGLIVPSALTGAFVLALIGLD